MAVPQLLASSLDMHCAAVYPDPSSSCMPTNNAYQHAATITRSNTDIDHTLKSISELHVLKNTEELHRVSVTPLQVCCPVLYG